MTAIHEATHDEIMQETPFGQVYSSMALLRNATHLSVDKRKRAMALQSRCAQMSEKVHEVAATSIGWLSIVGDGHNQAKECFIEPYSSFLSEGQELAARFAKSRCV